ncbi:MAG: ATP-binding protein [Bdellovibrionota bacterium]
MKPLNIVGRRAEIQSLNRALRSKKAEMIALYGRRRVGKTYLVRSFFKTQAAYLEIVGLKDGTLHQQLEIFTQALSEHFYSGIALQNPKNWQDALTLLDKEIKNLKKPLVIFLDELPWLATPKSHLLEQLDHFWNAKWSTNSHVKLILCGSAASWMIDNIVDAKGGLHNRLTDRLAIQPFTLKETEEYLKFQSIKLGRKQILELYMCLGGIPYYLNALKKGESTAQAINRICFQKNGLLFEEFERLYSSLFNNSNDYIQIVRALAKARQGVSRNQLLKTLKLPSGGRFAKKLKELEEAGFISSFVPFGKTAKDVTYRLVDEFSTFHISWIESAPKGIFSSKGTDYWKKIQSSQSFRSWCGFTFEGICLKHYKSLMTALDLDGLGVTPGSWRYVSKNPKEKGVQIDLLFDRSDGIITLCELKYYNDSFIISKDYAGDLEKKQQTFKNVMKIKKEVFLCLVTPSVATQNVHYGRCVDNEINLDGLFN